jgi:hypothetical protein
MPHATCQPPTPAANTLRADSEGANVKEEVGSKPETRNPKPETRNPKPETLDSNLKAPMSKRRL